MPDFPFTLCDERYLVEEVFADSGGMGLLYAARDRRCADNLVLIKTTRYDSGPDARHFRYTVDEAVDHVTATRKILEWEKKVLVRFRNEGLNNLPSPNNFFYDRSVTLQPRYEGKMGAFEMPAEVMGREPYLVMERIDGDVLESRMRDEAFRERLEEHMLAMAREILTIFIRLHRPIEVGGRDAYFLYQDLKPANLLVSAEDYFTLIDFGAVTMRLGDRTTEPTAGCITIGYAAPEASGGRESEIERPFDIYTLGATIWHVVTLQDPREMGEEFPHLDPRAMQGHGLSREFLRIVARALARDPEERYSHPATMRKDVLARLRELRRHH
jgi:serine/threonine protein kinase